MNLTELEKAYIAGIIDGEGSISCSYGNNGLPQLFVAVGMGKPILPLWLKEKIGTGTYSQCVSKYSHDGFMYQWNLAGATAKPLLEAIQPFIVLKREEVRIALLFIDTLKSRSQRQQKMSEEDLLEKFRLAELLRSYSVGRHKGKENPKNDLGVR